MTLQTDIAQQYQPKNSMLCGQTCVAMVGGISLEDAIQKVGKRGGTTGPDLHKALSKIGILSSEKMARLSVNSRVSRKQFDFDALPEKCIAKVRSVGINKSHWVLVWNGKIYDPYPGYVPWKYVSGYIEIKGKAV